MKVKLLAYTQLSDEFLEQVFPSDMESGLWDTDATDGQIVALSAIRNCYSHNKPSEIIGVEGDKYFNNKATDGKGGSEADRLIRFITNSGHTSTLEHISFTFSVEDVSRALLAQLTRHRVGFGYSVKSQRYVRLGSNDKSGGFDYVIPEKIEENKAAKDIFVNLMKQLQDTYDQLRQLKIPPEDARAILPNATVCDIVMTVNLRALLDFYSKRKPGKGAQSEIAELAESLRTAVIDVEPWTKDFFN